MAENESPIEKAEWRPPTYDEMRSLLNRIYIARNITLNEPVIIECLKQIDKWFADPGQHN